MLKHDWYVLQNQFNLLLCDDFVIVDIIASKSYEHPLFKCSHEQFHEEANELVMINSFISIGVDLFYNSVSNELWHIQILFSPHNTQVVLELSIDESIVNTA